MNPLSDESKKRLTEFLEERWLSNQECIDSYASNRELSPDDWQSLGDLKNKLVERGMWDGFEAWTFKKWDSMKPFGDYSRSLGQYADWLINSAIFIPLVDEFLKEKEET